MRSTRFPQSYHVDLAGVPGDRLRALFEDAVRRFGSTQQVLDCRVSFRRQGSDRTPDQVLDLLLGPEQDDGLWTCVFRYGQWELCASGLGEPSHFLYVYAPPAEGRALLADHGLTITSPD